VKILLVGKGEPDRGGIAAFLRQLLASDLAKKHELQFLNVAHADAPEGGRVSGGNIRRTITDSIDVWRTARGFDIVHIHSACAPGVTLLRAGLLAAAGRLRGCKVVVHAHGGRVALWLTNRSRRLFARMALRPAHRVVAVSTGGYDALRTTLPPRRTELIDNGVDVTRFRPTHLTHELPVVLYVGTLTKRKGLLDLFEASQLLLDDGLAHRLVVVGGTPDEGMGAEAEVTRSAPEHVQFIGQQLPEKMPETYAVADVFCLPSWWEAMPLSVLEAMACGLPVVATSVGDVPRLVQDGVTGFVIPARAPWEVATALRKLIADRPLAARMGAAGRVRAEDLFSLSSCTASIDRLYASLSVA
jgi:glycosyltransferase involved in cell wall biosynthesis